MIIWEKVSFEEISIGEFFSYQDTLRLKISDTQLYDFDREITSVVSNTQSKIYNLENVTITVKRGKNDS